MTDIAIDRLPVAQLPNRYNIARSVLYGRLSDLAIATEKRGNKAYVNAEQIELLDRLHQHIQAGGTTAEFLVSVGLSDEHKPDAIRPSAGLSAKPSVGQSVGQLAPIEPSTLLTVLMEAIASRTSPTPAPDPLANLEALEKACRHGWQLSTSQLAQLLGLKTLSGKTIQRYGFICTRVGRNGAESAWAITKSSE